MSQENTKLTTSMSSSSPSPSPPSSLDGVQVNIYHEKQIGSLCAIHAANNLLGKQQFTEEDFIAIQNELNIFEEEPRNFCHRICKPMFNLFSRYCKSTASEGNFDANVLMSALYKTNKTNLEFWDNRNKNIDEVILKLNKQNCAGCIINLRGNDGCLMSSVTKCLSLCFRPNGHWIAVKKISDGGIYNLNSSLKNGPIQINKNEGQLKEFFSKNIKNENYILFAMLEIEKKQE